MKLTELYLVVQSGVKGVKMDRRVLELKPNDFPLAIVLRLVGGDKEYILVKTKQDKLLLNKPVENTFCRK